MNHSEKELAILEKIHKSKDSIKQRDLAKIAGLSLGMTNAIMKRLIDKGYITVKKVNNRNIRYAVSPLGIEEISKRSLKYFKRTIKNVVVYKEALSDVIDMIKDDGFTEIVLVGKSDIDFIIEHECIKKTLKFSKSGITDEKKGKYYLFSENLEPEDADEQEDRGYLKKILIG